MLRDKRIILLSAVTLVVAALWGYALIPRGGTLSVAFLDVGEGCCAVARTPSGKIIVEDCGTSSWRDAESVGDKLAAPYVQKLGADSIDIAILSHPHSDHDSGFAHLLAVKPARLVLDIGVNSVSPYYRRFLKAVKKCHAVYRIAKSGQTIDTGDGVIIQILNPDPTETYSDLNNNCIVQRIIYKNVAFLLTADAEQETEHLLVTHHMQLRSQVLQVCHHGSRTASTQEWLDAVRPQAAIISCGKHNEYGHPSPEAIARLRSVGARIYRTDTQGAVTFITDGNTITAQAFRSN